LVPRICASPFVRPNFAEMVRAMDFIIKNDYPARGEYVDLVRRTQALDN
jgi:hypothetical protein